MDHEIIRIINKALDGSLLDKAEIVSLLSVENLSPEAFAIQQAGRRFTSELCDGKAEIHAHIGLDAAPCPIDCDFCSFAKSNGVFTEKVVHPIEKILQDARDFEAAGVNALYLVTTATYGKEHFLETASAVKQALTKNIPLVANISDFKYDYACELKKVGITGVYHVVRLGEGVHTKAHIKTRLATMKAAKEAGLVLSNCIDPIGPEHTPAEIADLILLAREYEVCFSGAMRRTTVPGTIFEKYGDIPYGRLATYAGATALATGPDIKFNCSHEPSQLTAQAGVNVMWASRGTDPRDTAAETRRGFSVQQVRDIYFETDWDVLEGPSLAYTQS